MHDTIIHNGKPTSRDEVASGPATAFSALQNMEFRVENMSTLPDADAAKGEHNFRCTIVLKPKEGDGRSIKDAGGFKEAFTYMFLDGRIKESATTLDIDAKKAELLAAAEAGED